MTADVTADVALRAALDAAAAATAPALALCLLDDAVKHEPRLDDAALWHHARANVLLALGRVDDGIVAADRAVTLAPGLPDLASTLGTALLARFRTHGAVSDLDSAARVLDDAVCMGPRTPQVRATLAVAWSQQGRHADAIVACDDNLRLFPDDAPTLFNRAAALLAMGRRDEAKATLSSLSLSFPPAAAALSRLI